MSNIYLFINAFFMGLRIFIPFLVLFKFTKLLNNKIDIDTLTTATNLLLSLAATVNLIFFVSEIFAAYYSQNNYEQIAVANRIFGPYWFAPAIQAFIYLLLPQMMWIKKVRTSIVSTIVWAGVIYLLMAIIYYLEHTGYMTGFEPTINLLAYLKSLIIFLSLLAAVYFVLLKQRSRIIPKQQANSTNL